MTVTISNKIEIMNWPSERDRFGLIVRQTAVVHDEFGNSDVVLILEPKTRSGEDVQISHSTHRAILQEASVSQQPKSLRDVLADLLTMAIVDPGIPKRVFLGRGLQIDLRVNNGDVHLQLSRMGVSPSHIEWKTTLAHFPTPVDVEPRKKIYQGRHYLIGSWQLEGSVSE